MIRHRAQARVPAETWKQKGKVEKRIDLYKHHFVNLNHELGLTEEARPSVWTTRLTWVANSHIRVKGFSPYQDRRPRRPSSH